MASRFIENHSEKLSSNGSYTVVVPKQLDIFNLSERVFSIHREIKS